MKKDLSEQAKRAIVKDLEDVTSFNRKTLKRSASASTLR